MSVRNDKTDALSASIEYVNEFEATGSIMLFDSCATTVSKQSGSPMYQIVFVTVEQYVVAVLYVRANHRNPPLRQGIHFLFDHVLLFRAYPRNNGILDMAQQVAHVVHCKGFNLVLLVTDVEARVENADE